MHTSAHWQKASIPKTLCTCRLPRILRGGAVIPKVSAAEQDGFVGYLDEKFSFIYSFLIILFIFGCAGSSLLCGLFSSCSKWGLLSSRSLWASHCGGSSCCGEPALGHKGFRSCSAWALEHSSVVVAWGLRCSVACGSLPRSGIKPVFLAFGKWILYHWPTGKAPLFIF